jgi:hypothetical protein
MSNNNFLTDFLTKKSKKSRRSRNAFEDVGSLPLHEQLVRLERKLQMRQAQYQAPGSFHQAWQGLPLGTLRTPAEGDCPRIEPRDSPLFHIVCLGLGKVSESRESQFQYIQLRSLAKAMKVFISTSLLHDRTRSCLSILS